MDRLLAIIFFLALGLLALKQFVNAGESRLGAATSAAEIASLAASVDAHDVVMYSTDSCPYAAQAKTWLKGNGFAFTECNMSVDRRCEQEFLSYGGDGTPYLVVRGHHMRDGFDSDEFLAALRR